VGEWPHDLVALLADQARQLEVAQLELRDLERRAVRLETENTELRSKVRDLQSVLRAVSAAMGESVNALTMHARHPQRLTRTLELGSFSADRSGGLAAVGCLAVVQ
jgi:hypothetical protein